MSVEINSIEGLKYIKENAEKIFVRIKREELKAVSISEMNALEVIDVLIKWIKQKRVINRIYKVIK